MNPQNTFLAAIRIACVSGVLAASLATPSFAASPAGEHENAAPRATHELNLSGLEQRVRDSRAISVLQKLSLQHRVDELLTRFRHAHAGGRQELAALRTPYDRLLASIESLLARDPQLASDVSASREAIWQALSDRTKFASL